MHSSTAQQAAEATQIRRRSLQTIPPSKLRLLPRTRGDRQINMQQLRIRERTLMKKPLGALAVTVFGFPHGSTAAGRRTTTLNQIWFKKSGSKASEKALLGGMQDFLNLTCAVACHQQSTARERNIRTPWNRPRSTMDLPSFGTEPHTANKAKAELKQLLCTARAAHPCPRRPAAPPERKG